MNHELYMQKCIDLAVIPGKEVGGNPHVGAVLVYKGRIIGQGYYEKYGGKHAEVNCLDSVADEDRPFISQSSLYVSLEPCCIYGKTPPCTDAIRRAEIKHVVIGAVDPNPEMSGKSIEILRKADIEVLHGILKEKAEDIIRSFKVNILTDRPYVTLKIAKSRDNYIGQKGKQVWLTNPYTGVLTHKWRSEHDAIMVGSETILVDNPALTTRNYPGEDPIRITVDRRARLSPDYQFFNDDHYMYFGNQSDIKNAYTATSVIDILRQLKENNIYRLMVEGGQELIESFIREKCWDEARIISTEHMLGSGIKAPNIIGRLHQKITLEKNEIHCLYRES